METEVLVKKWGNSLGVVLPKQLVDAENLSENDKIILDVRKEADLTKMFGSAKIGMSGQELKDLVRKGWK